MSLRTNAAPQGRTADLPLADRRRIEAEQERELGEGLTRRHVAIASEREAVAAIHFIRAIRKGPALRAALDKADSGEC